MIDTFIFPIIKSWGNSLRGGGIKFRLLDTSICGGGKVEKYLLGILGLISYGPFSCKKECSTTFLYTTFLQNRYACYAILHYNRQRSHCDRFPKKHSTIKLCDSAPPLDRPTKFKRFKFSTYKPPRR